MDDVLIGIAAALGACTVLLALLLVRASRRSSRQAAERVDGVVRTLERRMDELAGELAGTVARAEEDSRRNRLLAEIAGSIDLEDVLERTLELAAALGGAAGALIRLDAGEGKPLVAAHGMSPEEAARQAPSDPPDGRPARALELRYRYGDDATDRFRAALAVPLADAGARTGWLAVYTREPERRFGDDDVRRLEELAGRAGPALENARRYREARQLADLDALTGLHNRRCFHETLGREVSRAHRYGRRLALVVLDLDGFKEVNDRIGHLGGDAVLAETADRVREVVRTADVPSRIGGDEFAVIVPESGAEEAQQLVARIERAIGSRPVAQAGRLRLSAGIAELQQDEDALGLFERADAALYATKSAKGGASVTPIDGLG